MTHARFIFGLCSALLSSCSRSAPPADVPVAQVSFHNARIFTYRANQRVSESFAERLSIQPNGDFFAERPHVRLEPTAAGERRTFRADQAEGNLHRRHATGSGNVEWNVDHLRGKSERATFDAESQTAQSDRRTELSGPGYQLWSDGFKLELGDEHYVFGPNVVTRFERLP